MARVTEAHTQARTDSILDAAVAAFLEKGVDEVSMQDIADGAGLSKGTLYLYFPSKEALIAAVFERSLAANRELFAGASENRESPLEALGDIARAFFAQGEECMRFDLEMNLAAIRNPETVGPSVRSVLNEVVGTMERMFAAARDAGELSPAADDARALAVLGVALLPGLETLKLQMGEGVDIEAAVEAFGRLLAAPVADR